MHLTSDRKGTITKENYMQDRLLCRLYGSCAGRLLLRPLISPPVSKAAGRFLDSGVSRMFIAPFLRSHSICMREFEHRRYRSYNDFFKRKMLFGARKIERSDDVLISPCDSRLSVYNISQKSVFFIKHTRYTVQSLLRSRKLAGEFAGGYIWIFRLCVEDYHRYVYADSGYVSKNYRIPGVFHTVNPVANDQFPIYKENEREFALLSSRHFGTMLQMEVGALLVGKIENRPGGRKVKRGEEKGNFAFGGSTVILMTKRGAVCPDQDILENSAQGIETKVKLGERIGIEKKVEK